MAGTYTHVRSVTIIRVLVRYEFSHQYSDNLMSVKIPFLRYSVSAVGFLGKNFIGTWVSVCFVCY